METFIGTWSCENVIYSWNWIFMHYVYNKGDFVLRLRILVSLDQLYSIEFNVNNAVIPTDCNIIQLNWVFNSSYLSLFQLPTVDYNIIQLNNVVIPTDANNIQLNEVFNLSYFQLLTTSCFQQNSIELDLSFIWPKIWLSMKFNWIRTWTFCPQ